MSLATRPVASVPNDLQAFWVPFTPNRAFKKAPRLIVRAKDMHYYTVDGKAVIDGSAGRRGGAARARKCIPTRGPGRSAEAAWAAWGAPSPPHPRPQPAALIQQQAE